MRKTMQGRFLLGALLVIGVSQPLAAADRYVRGSIGSDVSDCSVPASPCQTISYAVTQSACSDTIHIHGDGGLVYDEAVTISFTCTSGTVFTLRDWAGNGTPVISSSVGDGLDISGAFIIIDGIRFDTNFANGILTSGAGVKNLTVQNSEFADNLGAAIESYGGGADDDWVIQNNAFDNNGNRAILFTGINVTIDGNTISLTQANQGILVDAAASGTFTITNNSVSGGGDPSVAGIEILSTGGGTCDVGGNRVYGNAGPVSTPGNRRARSRTTWSTTTGLTASDWRGTTSPS